MTVEVRLERVSKSFGGVRVLRDVDFDVRAGEVHALLGENGAGKSTLIKIIAGVHAPDTGLIHIGDQQFRALSPREARKGGIATVYQELLLFPELTVTENIFLGNAPRGRLNMLDWQQMRRRARQLLDSLDSPDLDVDAKVGSLSVANRQRVEIAKALSQDARVVIMDEPTAALADADVERLMAVIKRLRERGVAIIYVSHKLPEIFALADRVTVLRDGALIGTRPIAEVTEQTLVAMMVGREIDHMFPKAEAAIGETILKVRNLSYGQRVKDISFDLRRGEIVGVAGLVGAGRTELALTIFGITPADSGTIEVDGKPVRILSPRQARNLGIAYVPEDRGLQGLVRPMTIAQNTSMAALRHVASGIFISLTREARQAVEAIASLGVRARGPDQVVAQLSGGNQQKVVLGKWLETHPLILIMDEPTRGIDVGAKAEIHALMSRLAKEGMAILMISSELPEVLGMSDRILVMHGGRLAATIDRADATPETVGAAMTQAGAAGVAA
ncbi:sugar ABC transporter ATP-binding protein [Devosia nitrariae]|uniref:Ribose import ATP-binding protein RbsA 1 n=1 Tax=Devosia nitrariae TaxID=2071872 RepID=A0ABQ5W2M0_9HYPH|nr:sugar ABC transporter ATP-binding protein [Devosia nitrariae]GLQ53920.1 ribose import ATP-binding protein RbsA 1 [Devosia nitrariae]